MMPPEEIGHGQDNHDAGRVWAAPTFQVHGIRPQGGKRARSGERTSGYTSYYPSKSS